MTHDPFMTPMNMADASNVTIVAYTGPVACGKAKDGSIHFWRAKGTQRATFAPHTQPHYEQDWS